MTKLYLTLLAGTVLLYSCKSASKAYEKGDYTDAVERGVKKLQKDPSDRETKDLVQKSYTYAADQHEDQIRILANSKNENRYERIYQEYQSLQRLYELVHQYPVVAQLIRVKDYSDYLSTYREKAADVHLDRANRWMDEATKPAYREAYKEFNVALRYRPDDFELRRKRDQAYEAALTRVVIAPIQNLGGNLYASGYKIQAFQNSVIRTLSYNMNNDFIKFYTEWEARTNDVVPDQVMELNLSRISYRQPRDQRSSREVSKEVVVKEIVYKPDSVVKQYATVKAVITQTKRTLLSQADLFITMRDTRGRIVWDDRFTGEHRWHSEMVTYTGDERALGEQDKKQLNQQHYNPPTEEQILDELLQQIQNDLVSRMRSYYSRRQ